MLIVNFCFFLCFQFLFAVDHLHSMRIFIMCCTLIECVVCCWRCCFYFFVAAVSNTIFFFFLLNLGYFTSGTIVLCQSRAIIKLYKSKQLASIYCIVSIFSVFFSLPFICKYLLSMFMYDNARGSPWQFECWVAPWHPLRVSQLTININTFR